MQHLLFGADWTDINFAGKKNNKKWRSWGNRLNPEQCKLEAMKVYFMIGCISKSTVSSTKKMLVPVSLALVIPPGVLCPVLVSPYRKAVTMRRQSSRGISKWEPTWGFLFVCLFPRRSLNLCYRGIKYDWELLFKSRLIHHLYC